MVENHTKEVYLNKIFVIELTLVRLSRDANLWVLKRKFIKFSAVTSVLR